MPISRDKLRLQPQARLELLNKTRTGHCATVDQEGWPHVVPLWFVWHEDHLFVNSLKRSKRGRNLRDGSRVSFCVDAGEAYGELRGLVLKGRFEPETDETTLEAIKGLFGEKYWNGTAVPDLKSHEWFRLVIISEVSWDFRRIEEAGRDARLEALKLRGSEGSVR
ncbi:MAG: pyridoxamine 5'-phosphate oxidase family protein [Actinomycetota bacterium]